MFVFLSLHYCARTAFSDEMYICTDFIIYARVHNRGVIFSQNFHTTNIIHDVAKRARAVNKLLFCSCCFLASLFRRQNELSARESSFSHKLERECIVRAEHTHRRAPIPLIRRKKYTDMGETCAHAGFCARDFRRPRIKYVLARMR